MYEYLKGECVALREGQAILDVGGVGYALFVPPNISPSPEKITLYTAFIVREQSHTLFGFLSVEERDLFNRLVALSGIGPKTALGLVGHMGLDGIANAVSSGNASSLAKVPGIGKKTAERLLIELKGKLKLPTTTLGPSGEAISALITLGIGERQAHEALMLAKKELNDSSDVSQLISTALRLSKALT